MIHTSLSPNAEADDLWLVLKQLLLPWNWFSWKGGKDTRKFEQAFQQYLGVKHAVSFQRGRDALFQLLQALNVGKGHEVILQAYTCIVVPNAIQFTGAKPVYADIEVNGFNIDPNSIEE
ncbi:MAG: DegT/DnrJ/EryC1/StrS family aminotransferase, partial [bacterium]|nr:DegT/DnrJ/EryC1/StrS family aminotransferase [bacterium]